MAQIREIKRRIKSINNTSKVTHAMELVAAAKMRKAQEKTLQARPYTSTLHQLIADLRPQTHKKIHKLLRAPKTDTQMVILITTDRGLVGGLNLNLLHEVATFISENKNTKFLVVGKKGLSFAAKLGADVIASFHIGEKSDLDLARTLTKMATDAFLAGEVSAVYIIYPDFQSTIKQIPTIEKLLPIDLKLETETNTQTQKPNSLITPARQRLTPQAMSGRQQPNNPTEFLFEPSADQIIEDLLPHHVLTHVYQTLLEATASEQSARMVAMKNATDAASDLVDDLTLTYNQARQEAITKELLDIITAQSAFG